MLDSSPARNKQVTYTSSACCHNYSLCKSKFQTERQVVLTIMSAALGACRGHAVVDPTYATEKKEKEAL
jgi:hypothetical protein